ncbi:autophagy protein 16 [Pelomyxa schiedti]|nr:autophagy protein 16 [Pelomyxa schiedti]
MASYVEGGVTANNEIPTTPVQPPYVTGPPTDVDTTGTSVVAASAAVTVVAPLSPPIQPVSYVTASSQMASLQPALSALPTPPSPTVAPVFASVTPPAQPGMTPVVGATIECPPLVKQCIFNLLMARDMIKSSDVTQLIERNTELLQHEAVLVSQNHTLDQEVGQLRIENANFRRAKTVPTTNENASSYQQMVTKLTNELTDTLKRNSEYGKTIYQLTEENKQLTAKIAAKEKELSDLRSQFSEDEMARKKLESDLREKETTMSILRSELHSLQIDYIKQEEKAKQLRAENSVLVDRELRRKSEIASRMNEENITFQARQESAKPPVSPTPEPKAAVFLRSASALDANMRFDATHVKIPTAARKLLEGHQADINSVLYNLTGTLLVTGSTDKFIRVWDVATGVSKSVLGGSMQGINSVNISANDELVLGCSNDNIARVWTVNNGKLRHTLTGHTGKVYCGTFAENSRQVITGGYDRTLKVWDLVKGYCVRTIMCFSSCNDLCLCSSGMVISAHIDKGLRFWDVRNGQLEHIIDGLHQNHILSVCLSPDAKYSLSCGRDNVINLVDIGTFAKVATFRHDDFYAGVATKACFSPDGKYVASASTNGAIFVWNIGTKALEKILPPRTPTSAGCAINWNPLGHQVASSDKAVCVLWE